MSSAGEQSAGDRRRWLRMLRWGMVLVGAAFLIARTVWNDPVWLLFLVALGSCALLPTRGHWLHRSVWCLSLALALTTGVLSARSSHAYTNLRWAQAHPVLAFSVRRSEVMFYNWHPVSTASRKIVQPRRGALMSWGSFDHTDASGQAWRNRSLHLRPWLVVVFFLIYPAISLLVQSYLNRRWAARHHGKGCLHCGYNLTGNISGRCPECGEPVASAPRENRPGH